MPVLSIVSSVNASAALIDDAAPAAEPGCTACGWSPTWSTTFTQSALRSLHSLKHVLPRAAGCVGSFSVQLIWPFTIVDCQVGEPYSGGGYIT